MRARSRQVFLCLTGLLLASGAADAGGPFQFYSVTPCRLVDTRGPVGVNGGPALSSGSTRNFQIDTGVANCGIPTTAQAATFNVTLVGPTQNGFLIIWPYNTAQPATSNINAPANTPAIANGAIVPLSSDPSFQVSVVYGTQFAGTANVILDVTGYFQ